MVKGTRGEERYRRRDRRINKKKVGTNSIVRRGKNDIGTTPLHT